MREVAKNSRISEWFELNRNRISDVLFVAGLPLIMLTVITLITTCLLFAMNISIATFAFPLSILFTVVCCVLVTKNVCGRPQWLLLCASLVLSTGFLVAMHGFCRSMFDLSFDGQWYHQDAMILLKNGWNPFYASLARSEYRDELLANHYAQGAWIVRATYYAFTNSVESAKLFNWILIWSGFFLSASALIRCTKVSLGFALAIAVLAAFNPVAIQLSLSYYLDGHVASCTVILLAAFALFVHTGRYGYLWLFALVLVYFINLKFTASVFAAVYILCALVYLYASRHTGMRKYIMVIGSACLVGLCFVGYPTYIRNTVQHQHPFYPLMGPGNIGKEVSEVCYPANFFEMNRFEKLNASLFAVPRWSRAPEYAQPKELFANFDAKTLQHYINANPEMSGFGPLFAECLILASILFLLFIHLGFRNPVVRGILWVCLTILITIVIFPQSWYARYVPQLYVFFLLLIVVVHIASRVVRVSPSWLLISMFLLNTVLMLYPYINFQRAESNMIKAELDELKLRSDKQPIEIIPGWVKTQSVRLDEAGIRYTLNFNMKYPEECVLFKGAVGQSAYRKPAALPE